MSSTHDPRLSSLCTPYAHAHPTTNACMLFESLKFRSLLIRFTVCVLISGLEFWQHPRVADSFLMF